MKFEENVEPALMTADVPYLLVFQNERGNTVVRCNLDEDGIQEILKRARDAVKSEKTCIPTH